MTTVLLVDDDPGVRHLGSIVLKLSGNDVCSACDGLEALAILAREHVDLVILDLAMPGMDGRETFHEARREGYEGPILILSALGAASAARELGAEDSLSKPFDPEELVAISEKLLMRR
jgi:DNA-binding response OmpR family regulator